MLGNKEIMAKNIRNFLSKKGISQSMICSDLNIAPTTFSDWINAKTYPRIDKIELMANYFDCSKSQLVEDWDSIEWQPKTQEIYYIDDNSKELAQFLFDNPEYKILFDASKNVKPEDIKKAVKMLGLLNDEF